MNMDGRCWSFTTSHSRKEFEIVLLTDLEPRWIHPNLFVFLCPHCRNVYLTCRNIQMSHGEQFAIYEREFGEDWNTLVVPTNPAAVWTIAGTVPSDPKAAFVTDLTVTPSIDASNSGHWHGTITNGQISPTS